ncbi:MAG: hypothetical protein IT427_12290 [Pirellulales bacterium]|nr:hypothetical protein [Pirellulales bacterium]
MIAELQAKPTIPTEEQKRQFGEMLRSWIECVEVAGEDQQGTLEFFNNALDENCRTSRKMFS